jgi:hypothetical protein
MPLLIAAVVAITVLPPLAAQAGSWIRGEITAHEACFEALGEWRYELRIEWYNESGRDMSHFNLSLGQGTECDENDVTGEIFFLPLAGYLYRGGHTLPVACYAEYEMRGDPSLGITDPLLKFEPCMYMQRPVGESGSGKVLFWSDHPPADILMPNQFLSEKFGLDGITGEVTGVFPGLPCDPVGNETMDWGHLKATYR